MAPQNQTDRTAPAQWLDTAHAINHERWRKHSQGNLELIFHTTDTRNQIVPSNVSYMTPWGKMVMAPRGPTGSTLT